MLGKEHASKSTVTLEVCIRKLHEKVSKQYTKEKKKEKKKKRDIGFRACPNHSICWPAKGSIHENK